MIRYNLYFFLIDLVTATMWDILECMQMYLGVQVMKNTGEILLKKFMMKMG